MNFASLSATAERFGLVAGVHELVARAAQRAAAARAMHCMELVPSGARPTNHRLDVAQADTWGVLTRDTLLRHIKAAERHGSDALDLDEAFVHETCERGDECFGFLVDGRIAHYEFFSHRPTHINDGAWFVCPPGSVYGYKAFTHPDFRGRLLHGASVTRALARYAERGEPSIISYVVSNNLASVRSHERAGFVQFGSVVSVGSGSSRHVYVSRGARERGVEIHLDRPASASF